MNRYLKADDFFNKIFPEALTYDDISLATLYSEILPYQAETQVRLGGKITLSIPLLSADMDTVTGPQMAIALGLCGGMGVLHANMALEEQILAAQQVKAKTMCGVSLSVLRTQDGALDEKRMQDYVAALLKVGVDLVSISTAHGHSKGVGEAVRWLRKTFGTGLAIMAGNVTSAEGVSFLAEAGADIIKVGQGPGAICTTRMVAGVGIPQMTALYEASQAIKTHPVSLVADGGITKSGDIVKALTLADAVMCGSMLAGCDEAPGAVVEKEGVRYKQYRGMGSLEAMQAGSAARYGHTQAQLNQKRAAEGVVGLKKAIGPLEAVVGNLIGGLQSGMGYLGAKNLVALKSNARYVRITPAGQREAGPHSLA